MNDMPLESDFVKASFGQALHFIPHNAFPSEAVNFNIVKSLNYIIKIIYFLPSFFYDNNYYTCYDFLKKLELKYVVFLCIEFREKHSSSQLLGKY